MRKSRFRIKDKVKVLTPYNGTFYGIIEFAWCEIGGIPEYSVFIVNLGFNFSRVPEHMIVSVR